MMMDSLVGPDGSLWPVCPAMALVLLVAVVCVEPLRLSMLELLLLP